MIPKRQWWGLLSLSRSHLYITYPSANLRVTGLIKASTSRITDQMSLKGVDRVSCS
jgi:hypothetical protein